MQLIVSILPFISTFIGGLIGLRYKDRLHIILGFTAGVLLAVVAFDIFPEIIELTNKTSTQPILPMMAFVVAFLIFHVLEKLLLIHQTTHSHYKEHTHELNHQKNTTIGLVSALALCGHSFLDGIGIGLGFQVSTAAGILIALAVVAHDFSDGLNTIAIMLVHQHTDRKALSLLALDAVAPVLGALSTMLFTLPESFLLIYLGFFAGFLTYISTSEILPEAHAQHPSAKTIWMTILGVIFIYGITRLL